MSNTKEIEGFVNYYWDRIADGCSRQSALDKTRDTFNLSDEDYDFVVDGTKL